MSKHLSFVQYGLRWNVKDIMNYVIVRKFYGLGIHQHFIQRFNLNNNNPSVDFESMYNVSQLSFFIIITLHKRELHPEREYTINKTERRSRTEKHCEKDL